MKRRLNLFGLVVLTITLVVSITRCGGGGGDGGTAIVNPPPMNVSSKLPDTGQERCFNNTVEIQCPAEGEAFYGQDGQYSTNKLSYTDNGATVIDNFTGLVWQKEDDQQRYNWYEASGTYHVSYNPGSTDVCGSSTLEGHTDWRLPTTREYSSIFFFEHPLVVGSTSFPFPHRDPVGGLAYSVWTSSEATWQEAAFTVAGYPVPGMWPLDKTESRYVVCVRGASWGINDFTDNLDDTVTDNMSGLVWQQAEDGVIRAWQNALSYCEELSLGGSTSWRLPDAKELESVAAYGTNSTGVTIDLTYFPSAQGGEYWTSTSLVNDQDTSSSWTAYTKDFTSGGMGSNSVKDDTPYQSKSYNLVRCVR